MKANNNRTESVPAVACMEWLEVLAGRIEREVNDMLNSGAWYVTTGNAAQYLEHIVSELRAHSESTSKTLGMTDRRVDVWHWPGRLSAVRSMPLFERRFRACKKSMVENANQFDYGKRLPYSFCVMSEAQ